jgi:hypothetical protein
MRDPISENYFQNLQILSKYNGDIGLSPYLMPFIHLVHPKSSTYLYENADSRADDSASVSDDPTKPLVYPPMPPIIYPHPVSRSAHAPPPPPMMIQASPEYGLPWNYAIPSYLGGDALVYPELAASHPPLNDVSVSAPQPTNPNQILSVARGMVHQEVARLDSQDEDDDFKKDGSVAQIMHSHVSVQHHNSINSFQHPQYEFVPTGFPSIPFPYPPALPMHHSHVHPYFHFAPNNHVYPPYGFYAPQHMLLPHQPPHPLPLYAYDRSNHPSH